MFREAGLNPDTPPADWDELLEYAEKLTVRDGDAVTRAGFFHTNLRRTQHFHSFCQTERRTACRY